MNVDTITTIYTSSLPIAIEEIYISMLFFVSFVKFFNVSP